MKKLFGVALLALAFLAPNAAYALNCFWVGGTGTWDNSAITHWAPTTGGAATGCQTSNAAPGTGDTVTFDASSGGGTVTAAATINNLSLASITSGAFTGTLDFSANNPNLTLTGSGFNASGSGTRKYLMGTGTFTFTANGYVWFLGGSNVDVTSVFTANFVISYTGTGQVAFSGLSKTYGNLTVNANTSRGSIVIITSNTFANLSLAAGSNIVFTAGITTTIQNAFTWTGTSSLPIGIWVDNPASGSPPILSVASGTSTCTWCSIFESATAGGGTFNATNTIDLGRNTWTSIAAPSVGGGSRGIIGG